MSVISTSGPLPYKSGELSEVKRAPAVSAQAPIQTLQAKDEVTLDPEKGQSNSNGSLPVFEAWNEVSSGGVDGRDRTFARMDKPRNVADRQLQQANQDLAGDQNPSAHNNGNQSPQMVVQIRANQQKSPFPPGKDRGKDGHDGLPGQEHGSNNLGKGGLNQATSPSVGPSAGRANGNHAFSPSQAGDSDFSVKKNEAGKQKLGDSERIQRDVQEQSSRSALNNTQAGLDFAEQATGHGEARQAFHQNAELNRQDGTQNLQQASENTQLSKQAGEQGDLQKLLAKAQKMVQSMAKAQEAQGKAVEAGGRTTEAQGKATETTGQTIETTGHTTEANGHATEGTGVSMQGMGQSLLAAGAALVGGLFTAPVGAALMAQGGLLEMAGISTQMVGQGLQVSGQGLQAQGEGVQTVGKQVQDTGKKVQDQGKKTQDEAKKTEEEAKKKEDDHLQLFQKFAEEAKKLLEDAMQNKVDAGENFQKADENMDLGQKEGDHRDQTVDQANEANNTAGQDNERADKASDNLRALNEVQQKLFGKDEGSQDPKRENKSDVGVHAPGSVKGSEDGQAPITVPKPEHLEETEEEKDRRKKQNLNVLPLQKNSRGNRDGDSQSKGEARRDNAGQANPLAATPGGDGGQGQGQNPEGEPEESSGLMEDPGFGQAGSDLPKESGGDKEIEPVASAESKEGSATYVVSEEEASVRLNDLGDTNLKGSSLGSTGTGTSSSSLGGSRLGSNSFQSSALGESKLERTSTGAGELAGSSTVPSRLGTTGALRSL